MASLVVNGEAREAQHPQRNLLSYLRYDLQLTGTKYGCGEGLCGACTVLVDGTPLRACLTTVGAVAGGQITTIEGLARDGELHPVQQAFIDTGAVQCGFCIPGMILAGATLLERNPKPSDAEIRQAIAGNLCRCTGYTKIVEAIASAAGG